MPGGATIIGRVAVKVIPDTDDFRRDLKRDLDAIEKSLDEIKVHFVADIEEAKHEVDKAVSHAQRSADNVTLDLDVDNLSKKKIQGEISLLTRRRILPIAPKLEKAAVTKVLAGLAALSGGRAFHDIADDFVDWIRELDKAVPKIAAVGLAVTNLGSALIAGTSNLFAFGGSLATVAGSALALPGILGGMAIGAGTLFAALIDTNKVLPEIRQGFKDLQDQISSRFWAKAAGPIRSFFNSIFPQFSAGIENTSSALGRFFARLATSAKGGFNGELDQMFADLNKSIDIASRSTDAFVGIIEKLGSVGAGNLPRLARWFGDISDSFNTWLGKKGTSGLQHYVDTGIVTLKQLGGALKNTATLLAGLAEAAQRGGGGSVAALEDLTKRASDAVNSPKFQQALSGTFAAAHTAMDAITKRSGPAFRSFMLRLSDTLTASLPKAGEAAGTALAGIFKALDQPSVEKAVVNTFGRLDKAVNNIAPSLPAVGDALAAIVETIGKLTVNVSRALGPALQTLGDAVPQLADDLDPLITQLGDLLAHLVDFSGPVVRDFARDLGGIAKATAAILEPINALLGALDKLPDPIKNIGSELVALGLIVAAGSWFGAGVQTKILATGTAFARAGEQATLASGAFTRTGTAITAIGNRMSGMRAGLVVAGLSLMSLGDQAGNTNSALGQVASLGGAAVTGFFLGGPWGAALAVGGKALLDFQSAGEDTIDLEKRLALSIQDVITSLNQQTGAFTRSTKAKVVAKLEDSGLLKQAQDLGLPLKQLANAALEGGTAIDAWYSRMQKFAHTDAQASALFELRQSLKLLSGELGDSQQSWDRQRSAMGKATGDYQRVRETVQRLAQDYHLLPHEVKTIFEAVKLDPTIQNVRRLAKEYHTTPKTIRTLIGTIGVKTTLKDIGATKKELEKLKATKGDLRAFKNGVNKDLADLQRIASQKSKGVVKDLEQELAKGKAEMPKLKPSLSTLMGGAAALAKSQSPQIGTNLKQGIISGFSGTAEALAAMAAAAVRAAVAAAKHAGDIHSPSRKMIEVGQNLGDGLWIGLRRKAPQVAQTAADLVGKIIRVASRQVGKLNDKIQQQLTQLKNKYEQVYKKAGEAQKKHLKSELNGIKSARKAYQAQLSELAQGVQKLKNLRQQSKAYQQSVVDQIVSTGDPTRDGADSFDAIKKMMEIARDEAVKFAQTMKALKGKLNKETFAQIVAAGPEAGLAAAQAILASGNAGIDTLNDIQSDIDKAAQSLGVTASNSLFGAQIKQTAKDVKNLEKQLRPLKAKLQKLVRNMMDELAAEIRKGNKKVDHEVKKFGAGVDANPHSVSATASNKKSQSGTGNGPSAKAGTTFIYNAAPGPQLTAEEQLFSAAKRGRMVFS